MNGGSSIDPYILSTGLNEADYVSLSGKTQVSPVLVGGQTTAVFIVIGQSNACNHDDTLYTPSNSLVQNLNIWNGGVYTAKDPLLGASYSPGIGPSGVGPGGGWPGRLGDKLINASKYARVIFVPMSVGGTTVAQWASGGNCNHRIAVACKRIAAVGLTVTGILWSQGEQDAVNGTSQSSYANSLSSVITTFRNNSVSAPFFVALETWDGVSESASSAGKAAVRAGQSQVVDNVTIFQGADGDTLGNSNRQSDGTHWNATGSDAFAGLWQTVINAHL